MRAESQPNMKRIFLFFFYRMFLEEPTLHNLLVPMYILCILLCHTSNYYYTIYIDNNNKDLLFDCFKCFYKKCS